MAEEENIRLNFRLKKIDETRNYSIEETKENNLISKKQYGFKLHQAITYFSFCNLWNHFDFCYYFISWHFYRYSKFCSTIKDLRYNGGN